MLESNYLILHVCRLIQSPRITRLRRNDIFLHHLYVNQETLFALCRIPSSFHDGTVLSRIILYSCDSSITMTTHHSSWSVKSLDPSWNTRQDVSLVFKFSRRETYTRNGSEWSCASVIGRNLEDYEFSVNGTLFILQYVQHFIKYRIYFSNSLLV